MFTGIVEETGTIKYIRLAGMSGNIAIRAHTVLEDTRIGDSIAVNGICLTVVSIQPDGFTADVMAETIRRSALSSCRPGDVACVGRYFGFYKNDMYGHLVYHPF